MKKNIAIFISGCLLFAGCSMSADSSDNAVEPAILKSIEQKLSYTDAGKVIYNPDMGFYCLQSVKVLPTGVENLSSIYSEIESASSKIDSDGNYKDNYTFDLVHIEFDISAFSGRVSGSADKELTQKALSDIESIFEHYRNGSVEKTAIVRFAYDPDYKGEAHNGKYVEIEPLNWSTVILHVNALCPILKKYSDVITAIECGMLGPYGEMHSTYFAETKKDGKLCGYIVELMKTFMAGLKGTDLPLLVRQPRFVYCYLTDNRFYDGSYVPSKVTLLPQDDLYRIGFYNDGYLDGEDDSGTFKTDDGRDKEISFMDSFTNHTPYGGELIGVYDLENGDKQFRNVHVSFLNIGWNKNFFEQLDDGTIKYNGEKMFTHLLKHMGYRYILKSSSFDYYDSGKLLGINLSFQNDGFANLPYHRKKSVRLYFIPEGSSITGNEKYIEGKGDVFTGQEKMNVKADVSSLAAGTYAVYAKFCDAGTGKYAVQLANEGWNEKLKANRIGTFTK